MPTFAYIARDQAAQIRRGVEDAPSTAALVNTLRTRGWLVTDIRPASSTTRSYNPFDWLPPRSIDIELSLQQLAVMIRSGLTLLAAIRTVAEQATRSSMRRIWAEVADSIQQGSGLADAMEKHGRFPAMAVHLIRVGEQTGTLEPVLTRAAASMERRRLLRSSLLTAMAYPAVVLVAAIGVAIFMVFYIIPKIKVVLKVLGRKLPAMAQSLVDISEFAQTRLPGILGVVLLLTGGIILLYVTPRGRLFFDRLMLRLPLLGHLLRLSATIQFSYALGTLLRSGVTLVEGLATVGKLLSNRSAMMVVRGAREAVIRGGGLADQLANPWVFMPMLPRMVAVGESAGTLDDVLDEAARFHETQLQVAIRRLSILVEPAVVVVVGGMVGYVYIAFFMAMMAITGSVK